MNLMIKSGLVSLSLCIPLLGSAQSTFNQVYSIFQSKCTQACHTSQNTSGGLMLSGSETQVYNALVNVNPTNSNALNAGNKLIAPGYPGRSFLYRKINQGLYPTDNLHTDLEGSPMPLGNDPLTSVEKELVRQWIMFGAPQQGVVIQPSVLEQYYSGAGINSISEPPAAPTESGAFQVHLGKIFMAPQTEAEYFIKHDLRLTSDIRVDRIELFMAPESHHFILYKLTNQGVNMFADGLRLQNPQNGSGSSSGFNTLVNAWQISWDTRLPEGTSYLWSQGTVLDMNYHVRNYSIDSVLAVDAYINVYTEPQGTNSQIMYSDLISNLNIFIPANNQELTFTKSDFTSSATNYINLWQLTSHTHKYGTDYDIYLRNPNNTKGEQIYEGHFDTGYTFNQGFYDFAHPPIREFDPLLTVNPRNGLIQEAKYRNYGSVPVFFGLTTEDEMMVYYMQYTIGGVITETSTLISDPLLMHVSPNPSSDNPVIYLSIEDPEKLTLSIYDLQGRLVFNDVVNHMNKGNNVIHPNVNLEKGIYIIQLTGLKTGNAYSKRFIKL